MWLTWTSSYLRYIKNTFEHINKRIATSPESRKSPAGASAARRGEGDVRGRTRTPGRRAGCKDHRDLVRGQKSSSLHQFSQRTKWFLPFLQSVSPYPSSFFPSAFRYEPEYKKKIKQLHLSSYSHSRQCRRAERYDNKTSRCSMSEKVSANVS